MMAEKTGTERDGVDILGIYFREIARFPILSPEEERKTALEMAAGTDGARERLVTSNLRLVVKIAQEYAEVGLPLPDLIQEGNIGLLEAVDRFDVERGFRVGTYASWWIRRAILAAITEQARLIRIPDYLFRAVRRLADLRTEAGEQPLEDQEISAALGISAERLRQIEKEVSEVLSLDQPVDEESDETLEDQVEDTNSLSPEQEALRLLFREELEAILAEIPARQAFALRLHYGIEDGCPYNLSEVGRIMQVSRERARQLVGEGMERITERWGKQALEIYRDLL
jgi:RNA polymerase primary sigma factor